MELALSRDVAMDLDMDFGAVRADIDLGGLSLTRLEIATGASEVWSLPSRMRRPRPSVPIVSEEPLLCRR